MESHEIESSIILFMMGYVYRRVYGMLILVAFSEQWVSARFKVNILSTTTTKPN